LNSAISFVLRKMSVYRKKCRLLGAPFYTTLDLSDRNWQDFSTLGNIYQNSYYRSFEQLMKIVDMDSGFFDYFIDVGSGKGRICLWAAAKTKIPNIIGVEANKELHNIALTNIQKQSVQNIELYNVDARQFNLKSGNRILFYFNSMSPDDFEIFLQANQKLASENVILIYSVNDKLSHLDYCLQKIWTDIALKLSLYRFIV